MRLIASLLLSCFIAIPFVSAQDDLPMSGILNPDFASELATITTLNEADEEGIFVITPAGETVISMLKEEIVAVSSEQLGGFLTVYEESGQSLFELPNGAYQMQLTTSNGTVDFSYFNHDSDIQTEEHLSMEDNYLLAASEDQMYQFYLLTTGELSVAISSDDEDVVYSLTFTGIPALNIRQERRSK